MERNSNEQITLVFYDADLYSEFVCDAKNSFYYRCNAR